MNEERESTITGDDGRTFVVRYEPAPLWPMDIVSLISATWWVIALIGDPHLMHNNSTYTALRSLPQPYWALLAFLFALIHLPVFCHRVARCFRRRALLLIVAWWTGIGVLYLASSWFALGGGIHLALAVGVGLRLRRW